MSGDLFPEVSLIEQIREVEREIAYRHSVYNRLVGQGKMKADVARRHIYAMTAVLKTLRGLQA